MRGRGRKEHAHGYASPKAVSPMSSGRQRGHVVFTPTAAFYTHGSSDISFFSAVPTLAAAERSMHTATPPQRLCHPCRRAVNGATLCSRQQQHSTPTGAVTSVSSPLFRLSTAIAGLRIARVFNLTLTLTQSIQHIHRFAASTTVSRIDNK